MADYATIHVQAPDLTLSSNVEPKLGDTLLSCLLDIQSNMDERLGLRANCASSQCGLCAVKVDGYRNLACRVPIRPGQDYVVQPIDNRRHLQGLVCEVSDLISAFILQSGQRSELEDKRDFESLLCFPDADKES
jgi:succinate dehydrogenase/fumarate reductase-like Fe-S protein